MLEWTSHVCPAVARVYAGGVPQDTRRALASVGVRWVQIDSSWFAAELAHDVRAWRRRLGLAGDLLLDPGAEVAGLYGATATPQFFVIDPKGILVYSGALGDGQAEPGRGNHVLAAVRAALGATPAPSTRTVAWGCTIKATREPGSDLDDVDEEREARRSYRDAADAARDGHYDEALAALERAIAQGLPRPWDTLSDPSFQGLLRDDAARASLRARLDPRPALGELVLVTPGEEGEPFVLSGTVRDSSGSAVPGAIVSLYQTDAAGWYAPGTTEAQNPRLFGSLRTDSQGRYRIRTVLPGYYADAPPSEGLRHIHFDVRADGFRPNTGHRASIYFEDDPNLVGDSLLEIQGDGCAIRPRATNAEGSILCLHDVELRRE